ncbi:GNAT family N-acetyltransferase [Vibrio splendidus]|uniref:GNAT family N-acetyltransferase n=1 Tax=Vibrio splendidus TaxID=29497 RepID=UPI000C864849|nr:GNAT family N-acetyltransferase [Vibrio splendidus]PMO96333.1 GNAT family N-acetyltransferase [Vibrio splendidus]PMP25220.1 GNAT family N-acetyltransferase [Vibrio splendidus]PMP33602.1 GNAT family N-acetyltransferase [Vibrio splendidus]PMP34066.1 GNAT family N-acetyltransferase [Vibrio splendidus]PMP53395.1 GNAT family N-acetyltransferase [Vibrio splendidus]
MHLRKAQLHELDSIYTMGFDVWGGGLTLDDYLAGCRNSEKYLSGTWYVLVEKDRVVSSLIVYRDMFGLAKGCFGIGSVATPQELRHQGYASELINLVKTELFTRHNCKALYLHSDIEHQFYNRLGFVGIVGSDCMYISSDSFEFDGRIPDYL